MRNPLRKRILRELFGEWKKYLVLFLLLTIVIGFVSGMFVANNSMETSAKEAYEKYNIEDGHFELKNKATDALIDAFENEGITIFNQFYKDFDEDFDLDGSRDATVRVFVMRENVNRACLMSGKFPTNDGEIAIDRMHADNHGIAVGDTIRLNGREMKVSGLVAFADYSTLYESNSDILFDALTFNIASVTKECYDSLPEGEVYQYAFRYNKRPADTAEQKEMSDKLVEQLAILSLTGGMLDNADEAKELKTDIQKLTELEKYRGNFNELTDYVPEYANQAIHFATDDMGSDKSMGEILLIIFVVVLAFIFAITASNTITNESAVIGTLRSSGYTRFELLRHYIAVPVMITLIAALVGNILGYTLFKNVVVAMYFNSYSLPTYVTLWNADAFIKTTLYPVILMIAVNIIVVLRKLRFAPLKFLRRELSASKRKKAFRLPNWRFLRRFRARILIQNLTGYITLFLGIFFVMVLLAFSVGMPATLADYQDRALDYIVADYQYILKDTADADGNAVTTSEPTAERYSVSGLKTVDGVHIGEDVTVYGYVPNSRYIKLPSDLQEGEIYATVAYADKFGLKTGQRVTLKEKYTDKKYDFTVVGTYELPGTIAVFLPNDEFNRVFGLDEGSFTGFLSERELKDIKTENIASVLDAEDALKMAKQLDHSMGSYMTYFSYACMLVAMLIILLLTKLIIERNTVSISMVKVLGYTNREISGLYIRLTTIFVVVSSVLTAFLGIEVVNVIWRTMMNDMNGWFTFYFGAKEVIQIIVMLIVSYLVVALMDMRRIRRIPMTEALKNVE